MRLGLRSRILVLVLVVLTPPTVVAITVAIEERNEAREHARRDVLDSTRVVAADIGRVIGATGTFLAAVSEDLGHRHSRDHCKRLLALVPRATDRYASVGVASANGRVFCGSTLKGFIQPMDPVDVSHKAWFRGAQAGGRFLLADYGMDPLSGIPVLMASYPIPGGRSAPPSILFAGLDARRLADATAFGDTPRGTTFALLDDRGTVIARAPQMPHLIGRRLPERPLVETVLRRRQGTQELPGLDGVNRIQGFAPVGGRAGGRLYVVGGRETAEVLADPNADLRRFLLLSALGTVLALALSYVGTKLLLGRWTAGVVDSARRFGAGDLTARATVPRGLGELTDVANALNSAAEDIERREGQQAALLAQLVAAEEETRRRIAADIHDDTAQAVAAAALRIDALVGDLSDPVARETASNARQALVEANKRLRRLLFELRPPALDEAGLAAALESFLIDGFSDDGVDWRVENRLSDEPSPEMRAILYRVALEALTNVRRHARASVVEVVLERRGVGVAVRVHDNGRGFDPPAPDATVEHGHIGIVTMRERAEAAGGRFVLESMPGGGTTVDFWMPEPNGTPNPGGRGA
jgi:signal transduction histidine kinase